MLITFEEYISKIGGQSNLPAELDIIQPWENESFKDRFINRFKYREIGMDILENTDIKKYTHYLTMTLQECISLYNKKISDQIKHINTLYERTIKEETKDTTYINPLNANTGDDSKLKVSGVGKTEKTKSFNWLASNAKVMEEIGKLTILYEKALEYCERIFYGEY